MVFVHIANVMKSKESIIYIQRSYSHSLIHKRFGEQHRNIPKNQAKKKKPATVKRLPSHNCSLPTFKRKFSRMVFCVCHVARWHSSMFKNKNILHEMKIMRISYTFHSYIIFYKCSSNVNRRMVMNVYVRRWYNIPSMENVIVTKSCHFFFFVFVSVWYSRLAWELFTYK